MTIRKALVVDIPDLMDKVILAQRSTGNKTWRTRKAVAALENKKRRIVFVVEKL